MRSAMDFEHEIQTAMRELLDMARRSPASGEPICSKVLESIKAGVIEIKNASQQGILPELKTVSEYGSDADSRNLEGSKESVHGNNDGGPTRRNRRNNIKATELEPVEWLEGQLNSPAAFGSMHKLTEDWTNISQTIFGPQRTAVAASPVLTRSQPSDELSFLIYLGGSLSVSATEAWANAILRRIHCAFFYRLYTAAIEDARRGPASLFFQLSDKRIKACGETPIRKSYKGYTSSAAVRDRLVDLIFLNPAERPRISQGQCRERIHISHQDGKRWWRLFQTLGYKILLCLSSEVTDNRMKLTDAQLSVLLPAWEEQMRLMSKGRLLEIERVMEKTFMPYIRTHETIFEKQEGFSSLSDPTIYRTKSSIQGGEASVKGTSKLAPAPTNLAAGDGISSQKHVEARSGHPHLLVETVSERSGIHAEEIWQNGVEDYSVPVVPDLNADEVGEMIDDLMRKDQCS